MIGKIICNRYEVIEHLGTGGMATVWLAEDTILNRKVAIKTFKIDASDQDAIKRFNREANAVTSLSHENIVSIYGVENEENFYYLILEYVPGMTLKEYMIQHPKMTLETVVRIMEQISSGLSHAHKNGIIHRDIKPQNILLTEDLVCKITDFGISRSYGDTTMTQTNQMLGTVYYLSPEQARGNVATAQSDIYSLGILMFELLTGKIPFKGESAVAIALKHLQEELPSIDNYRQGIPQSVKNIVIKSTMKNPNERYISANELYEDLETSLDADRLNETSYKGFSNFSNAFEKTTVTTVPPIKATDQEAPYTNEQKQHSNRQQVLEQPIIGNNPRQSIDEKPEKKSSFWKILLAMLFVIFSLGVAFYTFNYYQGSSKVVVPDLRNVNVEKAKETLIKSDLDVGEIIEIASDEIEEGLVISTNPSSGKKLAKGSKVDLKVSSGKDTIDMPNYLGMTEEQVKKAIEKIGFKNIIFEKAESNDYQEGKVMAQSIAQGKEIVPKDTSVTITISKGTPSVTVPNFEGKTLDEAYEIADKLGLKIKVSGNEHSNKIEEGKIISQDPSTSSEVKKGSTISVVVSKGKEAIIKITVPDFLGEKLATVEAWANKNRVVLDIKVDEKSDKPSDTILKQSIPKGTSINENDTLVITIAE